jgi:serine/threonine protein kinase HipA of HipAB toxin-antitoxin module
VKEMTVSPGAIQAIARRALELLGALAIAGGLALVVSGILDDDNPTPDRLSPLFLERAKPAGDLLVVLEAPRDGEAIRLSALVQGPTRDDDPPQSVIVHLSDASGGQSRTVQLQALHPPEHYQSAPVVLQPGTWLGELEIIRSEGSTATSFRLEVGERVQVS